MVSRHGKLRKFFLDYEISQVFLFREFIPEAETVVIEPETQDHNPAGDALLQGHGHFIVMVTDFGFFSPHRFPCLVE